MGRISNDSLPWLLLPAIAATTTAYLLSHDQAQKRGPAKAPKILASLQNGFCGQNDILISRLPVNGTAAESYKNLLRVFHEWGTCVKVQGDSLASDRPSWDDLPHQELAGGGNSDGVALSRTTLIALFLLSNARIIYEYSDSSGYRAALGSWTGQWYINWSPGSPATATLKPHDSHSAATDVYPPTFHARVDRCIRMMAGVIIDTAEATSLKVAFPGRLAPGQYHLELQSKGYGLSHGSRHIYNMSGGKVFEIDFLFPRPIDAEHTATQDERVLYLPSLREDQKVSLYLTPGEQMSLAHAMDCLPWANLSWSLHRGMRDLLLAYSRETMELYRPLLAEELRNAAKSYHQNLVCSGWESAFAQGFMGDMAASAVLAGRGNSGDAVRIVTALAEQIHAAGIQQRDETSFWRQEHLSSSSPKTADQKLDPETVTALVKCFVLEWSVDFNYQMYHQLPITLLLS